MAEDNDSPGKREQNKASKRRRIREAAAELFTENGFEDTTTAAIAKQAGIGAGTLYLYVDSKEDLLASVFLEQLSPVWDEAFSRIGPTQPVLEQVLTLFNHVAEFHERDTNLSRAFLTNLRLAASPVMDHADHLVKTNNHRLADRFDQLQAGGRLHPGVSTNRLAENLHFVWSAQMVRRHAGRRTREEYVIDIEASFRACLCGLDLPD
ncbi:MAG: TetR/AcrR family transcriptional regulator [Actinomycetia bacterium]|nr:TetR/AcrR family transcriptional regulator [Actinomycetes bacterium]